MTSEQSGSRRDRSRPPNDGVEVLGAEPEAERLLGEVRTLLEDLRIGAHQPVELRSDLQRDLGLDSLAVIELFDRVERAFSVRLPEEVLAEASVAEWLRAVLAARGGSGVAVVTPSPLRHATTAEPFPERATTLADVIAFHAERHPTLPCVRLLGDATGEDVEELSFGELSVEAAAFARSLRARGVGEGERVAIMLPTSRAYFTAFLGALLAGGVPVPIYPPSRPAAIEEHLRRQARLLNNAGASVLVTVPEATVAARLMRSQVPSLHAICTPEDLAASVARPEALPALAPDGLALIQYTSGSTGDPKGVTLTNAQLLANIRSMGEAAAVTSADVFVSWLPLYHDMGLIGAFLAPLYFGFPLVVMSPLAFLARPVAWLDAITRYRGTLSAAPNFAYQSCVDRIGEEELERLDLSSWRLTFNGSEQVSARTVGAFAERFARCGFRPEAMCPAYGLAELGVGVAFSPLGHGPRIDWISRRTLGRSGEATPSPADDPETRSVVSCGRPLPGYELRVCDGQGDELPDRHEGAVSCRGPSATKQYFANDAATRALWRHGWLETGDLGYIADGELFLTGRAKDLVIRGGRNLHPEELEQAIEELDGVARGGAAVFSSADERLGTERLVVVVETEVDDPEARQRLVESVRQRSVDLLGAAADEVVLTRAGALARTASGKLRRAATRDAYETGTLGRSSPSVAIQLLRFALSGAVPTARRLLRAVGTWCFAAYAWGVTLAIAFPLWFAIHLVPTRRGRWRLVRVAGHTLRALVGVGLRVEGLPPPADSAAVVVANHESFVDGLVLILTFADPVVLVASTDLERLPLIGSFLRRLGCAFVARGEAERGSSTIDALVALARRGVRLVVFPEGSITRAPGLRPFRLGAFAVAAATPCPVVPIGISGSRGVVRPGTYLPRRGQIRVVLGSAIAPSGGDFAAQVELRDTARHAIAELSGEPDIAS